MLNLRSIRLLLSALWALIVAAPLVAQGGQVVRVIQTNSAGTNAHLIDPQTHEVLAVIEGVPHVHGVAAQFYGGGSTDLTRRADPQPTSHASPRLRGRWRLHAQWPKALEINGRPGVADTG